MKRVTLLIAAFVTVLAAGSAARADTIAWAGVAIGSGGNVSVDDPNNWSGLHVPIAGDDANMAVNGDANWITVPAGATFNPTGFLRYSHGSVNRKLVILKDLSLSGGLMLNFSTTSGGNASDQFRLGAAGTPVTLDLTGNSPFAFANQAGWYSINVLNATINLSGDNILLPTLGRTGSAAVAQASMSGGTGVADESSVQPIMSFTNVGGTVTLQAAGSRSGGTLGLGYVRMAVRSDQTWICDANGFIQRNYQEGSAGAGPFLVKSIDGGRLDNLGQVNFVLGGGVSTNATAVTAMQLGGGTYGSLNWNTGITSYRNNYLKLTGDADFSGRAVIPGSFGGNDATNVPYGLVMYASTQSGYGSHKYFLLSGYTLGLTNGLEILDNQHPLSTTAAVARIDANAGKINIGGDLLIYSANQGGSARLSNTYNDPNGQSRFNQAIGIDGGYEGVALTVGGHYSMNTRALTSGTGWDLTRSTVSMVGGTEAAPVTFEVADADGNYTLRKNSFGIGVLNIGAAGDSAQVQLVNDYLNENAKAAVWGEDLDTAKAGEKLIVGTLNILNGSVLDVNGQVVEVGSSTLSISSDSFLDLNTGVLLVDGNVVTNFYALGDQTAAWNDLAVRGRVIDGYNEDMENHLAFEAIYNADDGRTYWMATPVPEPTMMAILGAGAAALLLRRRRRT